MYSDAECIFTLFARAEVEKQLQGSSNQSYKKSRAENSSSTEPSSQSPVNTKGIIVQYNNLLINRGFQLILLGDI